MNILILGKEFPTCACELFVIITVANGMFSFLDLNSAYFGTSMAVDDRKH
jgi:hypothetical protein